MTFLSFIILCVKLNIKRERNSPVVNDETSYLERKENRWWIFFSVLSYFRKNV